jgi:nucleotide-binding universal stress UspA family protein
MKLIEKILVGTDFSPSANAALDRAVDLAGKFKSKIYLVHIIPEFDMTNLSMDMVQNAVEREMQALKDRVEDQGINIETKIGQGVPFIELMKISELKDVNVIMIGRDEKEKSPGMTAEKLMNKAIKPVWVVPGNQQNDMTNVLCPVDFSETSSRALQNAIHLSRKFEMELTVLHVMEHKASKYLFGSLFKEDNKEQQKAARQKKFDDYLSGFDFFNVRYKQLFREGDPAEMILAQAQRQNPSLVLMGSVGSTAHPKMLTGGTARSVFRELATGLITFKSENVIQLKLDNELLDLRLRFQQGMELMENGFVDEAIAHFNYCLNEDPLFAPAWELLADAHHRLGDEHKASEYKAKASEIRDKLWKQSVEMEVKNRHAAYNTKAKERT